MSIPILAARKVSMPWVKGVPGTSPVPLSIYGRMRRLSWVCLAVGLSLVLAATVWAQGAGSLEGHLVNGTTGGAEVGAGVPVVLHVYQGATEIETRETTTGADSDFRFEGLDTVPDLEYWPEALYQDALYTSAEPYRFDGEQTALDATITVYETTDDDSAVRLDSVHVIAESFGEVLRISEIHLFGNSGDRAFIGSPGDSEQGMTVFIPLPENAVGLSFGEGVDENQYIQVEGGLMGTEPIPPGTETALAFFSYHLMVTGESVPLMQQFAYPVTNFNMLVAQPGLALSSDQLQSRGIELFQERQYELYSTQNLGPETPLALEFTPLADSSGEPGTGEMPASNGERMAGATPRGNQPLILWIGVGLAALTLLGAVVYPMVDRRPTASTASAADLASNPKAQGLLAELAELKDAYAAGQVDDATFEGRRAQIYEELRSL